MIQHYFKIVWARRRTYLLVSATLFLSFIVLAFFSTIFYREVLNVWTPLGYEYENIYLFDIYGESIADKREAIPVIKQISRQIEQLPEVEVVSLTQDIQPLIVHSVYQKFEYEGTATHVPNHEVDDAYKELVRLPIKAGRWFGKQDNSARYPPIVINEKLKEEGFGGKDVIGETMVLGERTYKVVGLIDRYRGSPMREDQPLAFTRNSMTLPTDSLATKISIRFNEIANREDFEEKVEEIIKGTAVSNKWKIGLPETTKEIYEEGLLEVRLILGLGLAVSLILLSNIGIGIFGVFWNNVLRRYSEIGIRRAMGSTKVGIIKQILGEAMALTLMAIVPGALVFGQMSASGFAGMKFEYAIYPMLFASVFIIIFVLICAAYPSMLASRVQPAMALHEE